MESHATGTLIGMVRKYAFNRLLVGSTRSLGPATTLNGRSRISLRLAGLAAAYRLLQKGWELEVPQVDRIASAAKESRSLLIS